MAKGKEIEDGTRKRAKGSKIEENGENQSNKGKKKKNSKSKSKSSSRNGDAIDNNGIPEVLTVQNSDNIEGDEEEEEVVHDEGNDDEKEETNTSRGSKKAENGGGKEKEEVTKKKIKNGKIKKSDADESSNCFPMHRISRIIKSEDADIRITQESVFLVNKATEKFLELFCKEAYACARLDSKNQVWYKHLSSVVSKRKRFDFLLDIVPEKVKAEDAVAEMSVAETRQSLE